MRAALAAAAVTVLVLGAVVVAARDGRGPTTPPGGSGGQVVAAGAALQPFDACTDLAAYYAEVAAEQVGPYGLPFAGVHGWGVVMEDSVGLARGMAAGGDAAAESAAVPAPASAAGAGFSSTNVQETGIDEPDLAKTDGRLLVVATEGGVRILDVADGTPELLATHRLGFDAHQGHGPVELLLDGDRLLLLTTTYAGGPVPFAEGDDGADRIVPIPQQAPATALELVDLSDPAEPRAIARERVDGGYVSARLVDGVVRVVIRSSPTNLDLRAPLRGGVRAEQEALEHNRAAVAAATADDWLPHAVHEDLASGAPATTERTLVACNRVHRPPAPAGLTTTSVLALRLADGDLHAEDATAVVADADTVYAAPDRLYVAISRWTTPGGPVFWGRGPVDPGAPPEELPDIDSTSLHVFDTTDPVATTYRASGSVDGRILDQWSLSRHGDVLRIATTSGNPWEEARPSQSSVITLEERGDQLAALGRVDGLGPTETIHAVRFLGDLAYVVTFRQIDPLYTIDLADPAAPRVAGELKVTGFSAYLHPIGDDRLLGIGQDATEEGQLLGSQVSLFDVSDLAAPSRSDQVTLGAGQSEAEHDHHAFLWWEPRALAVVPVQLWGGVPVPEPIPVEPDEGAGGAAQPAEPPVDVPPVEPQEWSGAVLLTVDGTDLAEIGRVTHTDEAGDPWRGYVRRAVVVGDTLLTISEAGVEATHLGTLTTTGWVGF